MEEKQCGYTKTRTVTSIVILIGIKFSSTAYLYIISLLIFVGDVLVLRVM